MKCVELVWCLLMSPDQAIHWLGTTDLLFPGQVVDLPEVPKS